MPAVAPLAGVAVCAALLACSPPDREATSGLRCPDCNLLLISIDTLRADRLGSYGYARETSPHIDRLAESGLVFRDVLAQVASTAPSHKSIFSGRYLFQHRNDLGPLPVMAGLLKAQGYRTAAFVDGGALGAKFGMTKGFDRYVDIRRASRSAEEGLAGINPRFIRWLEDNAASRFFAFVHSYDVHCPYTPPEPYFSMFTGDYKPGFEVEDKCGLYYYNTLDLDPEAYAYIGALYDGGVRYMDERVAEILAALERLELDQNTVIVFTSDHGESLGERDVVGHNEVFEVQLKVPLIIRLPSRRHAVSEYPAQLIDLLPTLAAILGVDAPEGLPGTDLSQVLGSEVTTRLRFAQNHNSTMSAIRPDKRWSLLLRQGMPFALYDVIADPAEGTDLLAQSADVAGRLFAAYQGLRVPEGALGELPEGLDAGDLERLKALGYLE